MLTTVDNPFNPYTEWDQWLAYDRWLGYDTSAYLGRIVHSSEELSEADQLAAIDSAIDEIISEDVEGIYVRALDPNETQTK